MSAAELPFIQSRILSNGVLQFHGGALDGQAAKYVAGATGRGTVHLYNQTRSRTVIDCDGHG